MNDARFSRAVNRGAAAINVDRRGAAIVDDVSTALLLHDGDNVLHTKKHESENIHHPRLKVSCIIVLDFGGGARRRRH